MTFSTALLHLLQSTRPSLHFWARQRCTYDNKGLGALIGACQQTFLQAWHCKTWRSAASACYCPGKQPNTGGAQHASAAHTLQTSTTFHKRCVLLCSGNLGNTAARRGDRWQPAHSFVAQQSVLGVSGTLYPMWS